MVTIEINKDVTQDYMGLGLRGESEQERKAVVKALKKFFPGPFSIDDSLGKGHCGFYSVAKGLGLTWIDLRQKSHEYLQDLINSDRQNWIESSLSTADYQEYKDKIANPYSKIWLRSEIDLKIYSEVYKKTIHCIEVRVTTEKNQYGQDLCDENGDKIFKVFITDNYYQAGQEINGPHFEESQDRKALYEDPEIIHVITYNNHTVPVSMLPPLSVQPSSIELIKSVIENNDAKELHRLVRQGKIVDINARDENGRTALHLAIRNMRHAHDFGMLEALVNCGANPYLLDNEGYSIYTTATEMGYASELASHFFGSNRKNSNSLDEKSYHYFSQQLEDSLKSISLYFSLQRQNKFQFENTDQFDALLQTFYIMLQAKQQQMLHTEEFRAAVSEIANQLFEFSLDISAVNIDRVVIVANLFRYASMLNIVSGQKSEYLNFRDIYGNLVMTITDKMSLENLNTPFIRQSPYGKRIYSNKLLSELSQIYENCQVYNRFNEKLYHEVLASLLLNVSLIDFNVTNDNGRNIGHLISLVERERLRYKEEYSKPLLALMYAFINSIPNSEDDFERTPRDYFIALVNKTKVQLVKDAIPSFIRSELMSDDHERLKSTLIKWQNNTFGKKFSIKDNSGGWSLAQLAAVTGAKRILSHALDAQRKSGENFKEGLTPLHLAALANQVGVVKFLLTDLRCVHYIEARDREGITAKDYAASNGYPHIVELIETVEQKNAEYDEDEDLSRAIALSLQV